LYGLSPTPEVPRELAEQLRPAMTLAGRIALVKKVPAGTGVSYGLTYHTAADSTLALVPLGYADGVPRAGGNQAPVALAGRRFTIAGRVCMDQFVLDVGRETAETAQLGEGQVAVLFGDPSRGVPSAEDWAAATGTISYEIVTRVGSRLPHRYRGQAIS
jgi:alanine racemase